MAALGDLFVRRWGKKSLKRTIIVYLMICCLLPLVLLGVTTYFSTYSILKNKIENGIRAGLKQEAAGLENLLNNLDFASKQFALDGNIVVEVEQYLQTEQIFEKSTYMSNIQEKINLVNFTNPYLGVTTYYMPSATDPVLFTNLTVDPASFDPITQPLFMKYNGASYYGPHKTLYKDNGNLVFSSMRPVRIQSGPPIFIYLETNYNLFRKILNRETFGMEVSHLLINESGEATYVENRGMSIDLYRATAWNDAEAAYREYEGYYLFREKSEQGWELVAAVKKTTFNHEIYQWVLRITIISFGAIIFAMFLGWLIWRELYRPLRKLNQEIVHLAENRNRPVQLTQIEEFDWVLGNFQEMKRQINELILGAEVNERAKSRLEIEKLLTQINPHFLHNTLNTVQWLARMNGQKEIDKLVTLLVKVLHYNLGKQSLIVTIGEEIEALSNYMELQRIRYDYDFEYTLDVDNEVLDAVIPRFLLQPLVENAIYHGAVDGHFQVRITIVTIDEKYISLEVTDNGAGMDDQTIKELIQDEEETKKRGLGIGLSYVKRLVERFFSDRGDFRMRSVLGEGTTISIRFPRMAKEDIHD